MRKLFWGLTAVSVAAVGGMIWLKCLGPASPINFAATALVNCCGQGSGGDPDGATGVGDDLSAFQRPDDPIEIAEVRDLNTEPAALPIAGGSGVAEFTPQPIVPAITIREPIETLKPVAIAPSEPWTPESSGEQPFAKAALDPALLKALAMAMTAHDSGPVPAFMPYAKDDDDAVPSRMPYADEDDVVAKPQDDDCCHENKAAIKAVSFWSWFFPKAAAHTAGYGEDRQTPPGCGEEEYYRLHSSGCPYTGPCMQRMSIYMEPRKPAQPTVTPSSQEENEEPPVLKKKSDKALYEEFHKLMQKGEDMPGVPGVDTMEFRPSDRKPYEHLPNPI